MNLRTLTVIIIFLFTSNYFAQLSADIFLNIQLGSSFSAVKKMFPNEKWDEKEAGDKKLCAFINLLASDSVKISFMFNKADQLMMKSISNGKIDEASARKVYDHLKEIAVKSFGDKFEKKEILTKSLLIWHKEKGMTISLSIDGDRTILIILMMA